MPRRSPADRPTATPDTVEMVPIDSLLPHPDNPRQGDVDEIVASIQANGFYGVILVRRQTRHILAGTHRWMAAQRCGMDTIPVQWISCDARRARKILLGDNRISDLAAYDPSRLAAVLSDVLVDDPSGLTGTGWTATDLDRMLHDLTDEGTGSTTRALKPIRNTYWLVTVPSSRRAHVEAALTELRNVKGVTVAEAAN